jgi:hypothetical protein
MTIDENKHKIETSINSARLGTLRDVILREAVKLRDWVLGEAERLGDWETDWETGTETG